VGPARPHRPLYWRVPLLELHWEWELPPYWEDGRERRRQQIEGPNCPSLNPMGPPEAMMRCKKCFQNRIGQ